MIDATDVGLNRSRFQRWHRGLSAKFGRDTGVTVGQAGLGDMEIEVRLLDGLVASVEQGGRFNDPRRAAETQRSAAANRCES